MRRVVTVLATALLLIGTALLIKAATTPAYIDPVTFHASKAALVAEFKVRAKEIGGYDSLTPHEYHALEAEFEGRYRTLLDSHQTDKGTLDDYGATALVMGVALLAAGPFGGRLMRTPSRHWVFLVAMFVPALLMAGQYAAFAMAEISPPAGDDTPPWRDLPGGAVVMGGAIFGVLPIFWTCLHLWLVPRIYHGGQPLALAFSGYVDRWSCLWVVLGAAWTAYTAWHGQWQLLILALAWLHMYLSLAATRRATHFHGGEKLRRFSTWDTE